MITLDTADRNFDLVISFVFSLASQITPLASAPLALVVAANFGGEVALTALGLTVSVELGAILSSFGLVKGCSPAPYMF